MEEGLVLITAVGTDPELAIRLRSELAGLLCSVGLEGNALQPGIRELEARFGAVVYSMAVHRLAHLSFEPEEAKRHWERIFEHRAEMQRRLGSAIDVRVALLDYFVQVHRELENPKIIEMRLFERAEDSIYRDELTGLFNYRYFSQHLPREIARSQQLQTPLSLVMIDIDDFKGYNDRNGHDIGNTALAIVATLLAKALGQCETAVRYGGEEFAVVLPSTSKPTALELASGLRRSVERHRPEHDGEPIERLTISLGVATCPADAIGSGELIRCADQALYAAKGDGRNRVRPYGDSTRSYRRQDASVPCRFRTFEEDYRSGTITSIGDGGLLLIAKERLPEGTLVDVDGVSSDSESFTALGRVIRSEERPDGKVELAIVLVASPPLAT